MADIVLKELSNSDIDWMAANGQQVEFAPGADILPAGAIASHLNLILDGTVGLVIPTDRGDQEIATLTSGEVIGVLFLLKDYPLPMTVRAKDPTVILTIDRQLLMTKLSQDACFSARFYKAVALLLHERRQTMASYLPRDFVVQALYQKSILSVFSCLQDGDLCWMVSKGHTEKFQPGDVVLAEGKPLDTLYVMLTGRLSVSICEQERTPLVLAFGRSAQQLQAREVTEVLPGELLGANQFLRLGLNAYTMTASEESLLLSIPFPLLATRLQDDSGFAARFYRALASLTMEHIYDILCRIGRLDGSSQTGDRLDETLSSDSELDMDALQQMSVARTKFNWMLKQLRLKD